MLDLFFCFVRIGVVWLVLIVLLWLVLLGLFRLLCFGLKPATSTAAKKAPNIRIASYAFLLPS